MNNLILNPVLCMAILTFFMMIWMYATRIPASRILEEKGIDLQGLSHPSKLGGIFPSKVERVADNYNHLFEQPTVFYAIIFILFRLFDIIKPFPVSYFDKKFKNSFGVIFDDICAGLYVVLILVVYMVLK